MAKFLSKQSRDLISSSKKKKNELFLLKAKDYVNSLGYNCDQLSKQLILKVYKDQLKEIPKCLECKKLTNYRNGKFTKFCSNECYHKSSLSLEKRKKTNLERYGVENPSHRKEVVAKIQSHPNTIKNKENQSKKNRDRGWDSILEFENTSPNFTREEYLGGHKEYEWRCKQCSSIFEAFRWMNEPRCPKCFGKSGPTDIEDMMIKFLKKEGIFFTKNDRKVIDNFELDFYLPYHNIAIELNGLYWHGHKFKQPNYHLDKTNLCKEYGIELLHFFEDEMICKFNIIKSMILNKIGKTKNKIYTRNCEFKVITDVCLKDDFLNDYHLQGQDASSIRYGLYHDNELVSLMTFVKPRFNKNYDYEIGRFCTKLNTNVVGAGSKFIKEFKREFGEGVKLLTYCDRRYSQGLGYESMGFTKISESRPSYFYFKHRNMRYHRSSFQKHKLSNKLNKFDVNKTEYENMVDNGYDKIYDCGTMAYEMIT